LRAQRSELPFTLEVPNKGTVCGVLYYFPYENDHETVPQENVASSTKPIMPSPFAPTQLPVMSQMPLATQAHRQGGDGGGVSEDEEVEVAAWRAPIFEAFWQGRLIPGARIESLPFIETVRQKRSAQVKDSVPDEAFNRLRGALFFGPAFKVTRNK
jgi:structural maintenance of chromosomes flexible hinge domain-containing protein 1